MVFINVLKKDDLLRDWLEYIQYISSTSIDLSLDRVRCIAQELKLIPFETYTILIGGTNGKGTTCYLLEKVLLTHQIKVGLYISPHLLSYNERIRVCGKLLPSDVHVQSISVIETVRSNLALTYFEFSTLSALYIFKQFKLDVIILEVGLGGRLDATNIINPDISVITNVAIDHTDFLGSTRYDIAIEKTGIFRENKPAIVGEADYPLVINKIVICKESILFARGRDWDFHCYENQWYWKTFRSNYQKLLSNLPIPSIPLENAAIVLSILYWMPFPIYKRLICYALNSIIVLGRFQIISYAPFIILDVGHNPSAAIYIIRKLSSILLRRQRRGLVRVIIGMLKNKDIASTVYILSKLVNVWYCSNLNTPLSANIEHMRNYLMYFDVKYFESIESAWYQAISDSSVDDCILVFGSFYAIQPIIRMILPVVNYTN